MGEEKKLNTLPQQPEEQEIDLIELAKKVWAERKLVFKACGYAALIGLVVAFSIPREYSTSVTPRFRQSAVFSRSFLIILMTPIRKRKIKSSISV